MARALPSLPGVLPALLAALLTTIVTLLTFHTPVTIAQTAEEVDLDMVTRIRQEGFYRSQVMETLQHLTDVIGSRLTGSPGMDAANAWTRDKLSEWGLSDARLEGFYFVKGWSVEGVQFNILI